MAEHRVRIAPVRIRRRDAELEVDVVRGVGFRAACSCAWRGPVRANVAAARGDRLAHVRSSSSS